ncbi:DUF3606 domain-containing protein [Methylobacterium sp. ARG-1]|uniref:DUF3606 domain-containing protein n=1 Tax=Methylobacterium sp. ARG-1 TaxID=1692501 RepID=UPI000AAAE65F|nr:DUF3606 domain-containing protein [Methylobacterium sp. ARG-1]
MHGNKMPVVVFSLYPNSCIRSVPVSGATSHFMAETHNTSAERSHLDVWDRSAREQFAARLGISDEKLRQAIRMVGSRIATLSSYLKV